jgi:hypothetical protein
LPRVWTVLQTTQVCDLFADGLKPFLEECGVIKDKQQIINDLLVIGVLESPL